MLDSIIGIVPSDVITPFLRSDMLKIIFMAIMLGIACGALSDRIKVLKDFLTDAYLVVEKITQIIIRAMPFAIFCSMAKMVISMDAGTLLSVFSWVPVTFVANVALIILYGIMIPIFAGLNPIVFFKKYYPAMLTGFTFASSNAALPTAMDICEHKLGISKKL
ncbi:MAG: dicarboxylate/amino acid:cation symporter, partial [Lachnospiraceae bacterium]|nr:dicarboxylate/amino acid:cation symporter [Lachnospiraceae bacterium]